MTQEDKIVAEIAEKYAACDELFTTQDVTRGTLKAAIREAISTARKTEWIPVSDERKPSLAPGEDSLSIDVLLFVPTWRDRGPVVMGKYLHGSKYFRPDGSSGWEKAVTHWQPLPAPPCSSHSDGKDSTR